MNKIYLFTAAFCLFVFSLQSQTLVSSTYLGNKTVQELEQFDTPIMNGADYYQIIYTTSDLDGNSTEASGLLAVPDDLTKRYPRAVYQHGTAGNDEGVPSFESYEANIALTFAGKGYVVCAPDYLGLGVNPGLHPYVHADSEAWVAADMLRAVDQFLADNDIEVNEQVFLTGYSQGGHASAALHLAMEQEWSDEFTVTAGAHMSGPYSISGVMRDLLFSDEPYGNPGYLIYTMVSMQLVYGDLYNSIDEAVKEPYRNLVANFADDDISLEDMNAELINLLNSNEGAVVVKEAFEPTFVAAVESDDNHPVNVALRKQDVYDWAPAAPTRLYYCMADEQVPFENSIIAEEAMQAAGGTDVEAIDVNSFLSHGFCALFAPGEAADWFAQFQVIEDLSPSSTIVAASSPLELYPNPAGEVAFIKNFPTEGTARIFDMSGKMLLSQNITTGDNELNISGLNGGIYLLEVLSDGFFWKEKLAVR